MVNPKKNSEKKVRVIFTLAAETKKALLKKVKRGKRSAFVNALLAKELGIKLQAGEEVLQSQEPKEQEKKGGFLRNLFN